MQLKNITNIVRNILISAVILTLLFYKIKILDIFNLINPTYFLLENKEKHKQMVSLDNETLYYILKIDEISTQDNCMYDFLYHFFYSHLKSLMQEFPYLKVKIILTLDNQKATETLSSVLSFFRDALNEVEYLIDYNGKIAKNYKLSKRTNAKVFAMVIDKSTIKIAPLNQTNALILSMVILNHLTKGQIINELSQIEDNHIASHPKIIDDPIPFPDINFYPKDIEEFLVPEAWTAIDKIDVITNEMRQIDNNFVTTHGNIVGDSTSSLDINFYPKDIEEFLVPEAWTAMNVNEAY